MKKQACQHRRCLQPTRTGGGQWAMRPDGGDSDGEVSNDSTVPYGGSPLQYGRQLQAAHAAHEMPDAAVAHAHTASASAPPSSSLKVDQEELPLEADEYERTPAVAKHPLSVVDSEELKRKSHGLSLLSPESDEPRPLPAGARARSLFFFPCPRPMLAVQTARSNRPLLRAIAEPIVRACGTCAQACKIATRARRQTASLPASPARRCRRAWSPGTGRNCWGRGPSCRYARH